MPYKEDLLSYLSAYLGGNVQLAEFQAWFSGALWNIGRSDDYAARALAKSVVFQLQDFRLVHCTEAILRLRLLELVQNATVSHGN